MRELAAIVGAVRIDTATVAREKRTRFPVKDQALPFFAWGEETVFDFRLREIQPGGQPLDIRGRQNRAGLAAAVGACAAIDLPRNVLVVPLNDGVEFFKIPVGRFEETAEPPVLFLPFLGEFLNDLGIRLQFHPFLPSSPIADHAPDTPFLY
jgi:hypothetical protein